jgi:hypothetical protein
MVSFTELHLIEPFDLYTVFVLYVFGNEVLTMFGIMAMVFLLGILLDTSYTTSGLISIVFMVCFASWALPWGGFIVLMAFVATFYSAWGLGRKWEG